MNKKFWLVRGYDGAEQVFERKLPASLTEAEVSVMLRSLAARDLTQSEIIDASLRKDMEGYRPLLVVRRDSAGHGMMSSGENPHYVASIISEKN